MNPNNFIFVSKERFSDFKSKNPNLQKHLVSTSLDEIITYNKMNTGRSYPYSIVAYERIYRIGIANPNNQYAIAANEVQL